MSIGLRNFYMADGSSKSAKIGDILIQDGVIKSLGQDKAARADEILDGKGHMAVIPSFCNAHTHSAMILLRGLGEERPLKEWLEEKIWPVENHLNPERVYWGTKSALLEMASTGVTCFGDMYIEMDQVVKASREAGMKCGICRGIVGDGDDKLKEGLDLADLYKNSGDVRVQLGPHGTYTVTLERLKIIAEAAKDKGIGVHFHYLEGKWERAYIKDNFSLTTGEYLDQSGLLEVPYLILAHGVWIPKEDMEALASCNVTVVHNPSSNLKLGSGIAPLKDLFDFGVKVALGTDGAASNNRLDMWEEMRTSALLHKGFLLDPTAIKSQEILDCATYWGHRALGFEKTGRIKEGWKADLTVVDLDKPHYIGADRENLTDFLVYAGSSSDVFATMCEGKWIYKGGNFPGLDVQEIKSKALSARSDMIRLSQGS